jgi:hypothetical protein
VADILPRQSNQLVKGIAIGVALTALVGGILIAADVVKVGSESKSGVNRTPIELPDKLGRFRDQLDAFSARGEVPADLTERVESTSRLTAEAFTKAYGGAAAASHSYADAELIYFANVVAVRAESPGLGIGTVTDPEQLGMAVGQNLLVEIGDVSCIAYTGAFVPAGEDVDTAAFTYGTCQRTGPGLTIIVQGSGFEGDDGKKVVVDLVNDAFDYLSA